MPTISVRAGTVNLRNGSARCLVWHCPRPGGAGGDTECVLAGAAKHARINGAVRQTNAWVADVPAVNGYDSKVGGSIFAHTYEIAEGELIKVFAQRRAPGDMQGDMTANRFYRVRAGAPVITVHVKLLADARCPVSEATVTGPMEAMTVEQVEAMGIVIPPHFKRKVYDPAVAAHLMRETVIQAATVPVQMQTLHTPEGKPVIVEEVRQRRRLSTAAK